MNTNKIAKIVGWLFVITMIVGMVDAYLVAPILKKTITDFYSNQSLMIAGAMLIMVMAIGIVGIAVVIYPFFRRYSETIAITYVSFRTIECVLLVVGSIVYLFLILLSKEFITAGSPDASHFQSIGTLAIGIRYFAYQIAMIFLGLCGTLFSYLLYKTKLIPKPISTLGLISYILLLASALLDIFGIISTQGLGIIMYIPGTLFELILLPLWLILKGFNASVPTPSK